VSPARLLLAAPSLYHKPLPDKLRLLDWNGHLGAIVASSFSITNAMFSPSGQSIAYMVEDKQRVEIYDIPTGNHITVFKGNVPLALSGKGGSGRISHEE
jgi:WD40 repeat protein